MKKPATIKERMTNAYMRGFHAAASGLSPPSADECPRPCAYTAGFDYGATVRKRAQKKAEAYARTNG